MRNTDNLETKKYLENKEQEQTKRFIMADSSIIEKIKLEFGEKHADYLHFTDGFTYAAFDGKEIAGFISVSIKKLPYVFDKNFESFINIIEVKEKYRKQGIARELLDLVERKSKEDEIYQIRAWSSEDKKEAIEMWKN